MAVVVVVVVVVVGAVTTIMATIAGTTSNTDSRRVRRRLVVVGHKCGARHNSGNSSRSSRHSVLFGAASGYALFGRHDSDLE